jgi:glycosyltransferase involved in cell wall biosynthesis
MTSQSPPHNPIRFAIVTPTYNRPDRLLRCGDSVFAQTYEHWTWIVSNDGSTADYSDVESKLNDDRVIFLKAPSNGGVLRARNLALDQIDPDKYDFVVFLDDDDQLTKDCLLVATQQIENHAQYQWFVSDVENIATGKTTGKPISANRSADYLVDFILTRSILGDKTHIISVDAIGEYRFNPKGREEWTLLSQIANKHRIWLYSHISKQCEYLESGITSNRRPPGSRDGYGAGDFIRAFAPIRRAATVIKLRPFHWQAHTMLYRQLLLLPFRFTQLAALTFHTNVLKKPACS